VINIIKIKEE
jgi:hypothetical protein